MLSKFYKKKLFCYILTFLLMLWHKKIHFHRTSRHAFLLPNWWSWRRSWRCKLNPACSVGNPAGSSKIRHPVSFSASPSRRHSRSLWSILAPPLVKRRRGVKGLVASPSRFFVLPPSTRWIISFPVVRCEEKKGGRGWDWKEKEEKDYDVMLWCSVFYCCVLFSPSFCYCWCQKTMWVSVYPHFFVYMFVFVIILRRECVLSQKTRQHAVNASRVRHLCQ